MRDEIRLGNEALGRNDLDTARKWFQQLLANGGTPTQERIATNRLREIQEKQEPPRKPPAAKRRPRRKASANTEDDTTPGRTLARLPDKPLVTIRRH